MSDQLAQEIGSTVNTDYGMTDCGQSWAALSFEEMPEGSWGRSGSLVSIVTVAGVPRLTGVMSADGQALVDACEFSEALGAAKVAGMREYAAMRSEVFATA